MSKYHKFPFIHSYNYDRTYTRKEAISFMKMKLATDRKWAFRGFLRLIEVMWDDEINNGVPTVHDNYGFDKCDTPLMTMYYRRCNKEGLYPENFYKLLLRIMPKYAVQLISISDGNQLAKSLDNYYINGVI